MEQGVDGFEIELKRQMVNLSIDAKSVVFTSEDINDPFEFEFEWDDIFYLCWKEVQ